MLSEATVSVDLAKIEENARRIVAALPGVSVVGVTKVTCGTPEVASAMLAGGVSAIGESRLENVARMREAGIDAPFWLLRSTVPAAAEDVVQLADVSLESEPPALRALNAAASGFSSRHKVVGMVDVGDLREGMMPDELPDFLREIEALDHLELIGLGTSLTCYGAIVPDKDNLGMLAALTAAGSNGLGRRLIVSGGSSTSIELVASGALKGAVDNLRIGEAIVLGVDPASRQPIPGIELHRDAVVVSAPVIECRVKPSIPLGTAAQDAFGTTPTFEDRGDRLRAVLALGRQDAPAEGLRPLQDGVEVLGASSDHTIVDVDAMVDPPAVGDALSFVPGYSATLQLFTSPYVRKEFTGA